MLIRNRQTTHINRRTTQAIFRAFDYAAAKGAPLTHYVVIHLSDTPYKSAATAFEEIRHKFRDWQKYALAKYGKKLPPHYVFTMENKSGSPHVNWAVHIPPELTKEFEGKLLNWVEKIQGSLGAFTVRTKLIAQDYAKRLAKYMVKGTDPDFVEHFHLQGVHVPQGVFVGKRAGFSPSLGPTARKRAKFHPQRRRYWQQAA